MNRYTIATIVLMLGCASPAMAGAFDECHTSGDQAAVTRCLLGRCRYGCLGHACSPSAAAGIDTRPSAMAALYAAWSRAFTSA